MKTEPYLGAGGHLVALREGDLAFLHVHPTGHGDATPAMTRVRRLRGDLPDRGPLSAVPAVPARGPRPDRRLHAGRRAVSLRLPHLGRRRRRRRLRPMRRRRAAGHPLTAGTASHVLNFIESESQTRLEKGTHMQTAHPRRWSALAVIALAQFMVIMDTSIIGVALPEIQSDLGFTPDDLSWVFNAYVVAFGGLLLLGGRLSDLFGAKRMFSLGWAVLAAGSLAAGLADSTGVEIAARAVQGAGAALIAPSALTLLMMLFGSNPKELTKAFAVYGAAAPAGGTAGVFLGGVITEWISWPWVFYINIPIALLVLAVTPGLMPAAPARRGSIDIARRAHRHRRPRADRLRHRPRARGGLGLDRDARQRWPAAWRCSLAFVALQARGVSR